MKRIYNYRTNKLYEFETSGRDTKKKANEFLNESDADVVMYKLCVREDALSDDVEVDDDVEFEDRYETLEDALAAVDDAMLSAAETEDEDFEELDCDDCDDCRVFESPSKRYIFVACPEDEEPNFEIELEDDGEFERELEDDFEDELEDDLEDVPLDDDFEDELEDDLKNESVASRFSRLCNLFEAEGEDDSEESEESDDSEESEDTENGDSDEDTSDAEGEESEDSEESEDEEMKAVAITVKTDDVDACKEELIDAGIAEDDIEVLDDNDGETEIRIDVNSIMELKDYLSKKGIDLEEEIGGEIVSDDDSEDDSDEEGSDAESNEDDPDAEQEVPDLDLDDLGDIFGAEE